jgi:hypothetical protein
LVNSRFQIANKGGQQLLIDQVKSSCGCGHLYREIDGKSELVEKLCLAPGERADLSTQTLIQANSAGTYSRTFTLWTNDPSQPQAQITIVYRTASGGLRFHPNAANFPRLLIGQKARQVVEVFDRDQSPQTVTNVVSTDPERVAIRWMPTNNQERRNDEVLLGQVEIVPNTANPLMIDADVRIEFADPKIQAATLHVSGRVTSMFEVSPQSLVLPLSSRDGPVYTRKCVVRMADDRPWLLEIEAVSPGLKVELPKASKGAVHVVQIAWAPAPEDGPGSIQKTVRLRAKSGKESESIQIPVTCEHK